LIASLKASVERLKSEKEGSLERAKALETKQIDHLQSEINELKMVIKDLSKKAQGNAFYR